MMVGGQQHPQQQHLVKGTSFPPSATGTPQQLQRERESTMAMAITLY
eukprot:CAMPEP_0168297454 /NCGR_PEP_ID=MMETSP0142_2-20121227/19100_1 /TAXON_ID=44445 /ORGANISM="Pseudo-nitzschia australis, Strain 10249 10 AB" /LENGTH=46 /DNA_ID= /DNA_START= /DNA_END= /DNA_ORIENTATION=